MEDINETQINNPKGMYDDILLTAAAKIVLRKLSECPLLCGVYDARNGKDNYMFGVSTVMEMIANLAGDTGFEKMFLSNMVDSEERAEENGGLNGE